MGGCLWVGVRGWVFVGSGFSVELFSFSGFLFLWVVVGILRFVYVVCVFVRVHVYSTRATP